MKGNINYVILFLLTFVVICFDIVLYYVEESIYNVTFIDFSSLQLKRHWSVIIVFWAIASILIVWLSKKWCNYNVFKTQKIARKWHLVCGFIFPVFVIGILLFFKGNLGFISYYVRNTEMFFYQYLYYALEMFLAGLIVSISQKYADNITNKVSIPWGGIVLGLSWGIIHWLTKGNFGIVIVSLIFSLLYGFIYILLGKNFKITWLIMYITFICF